MTASIIPFPASARKPWFTVSGSRIFARTLSGHLREVSIETLFVLAQNIEADARFAVKMRLDGLIEIIGQKRADLAAVWAQLQAEAFDVSA